MFVSACTVKRRQGKIRGGAPPSDQLPAFPITEALGVVLIIYEILSMWDLPLSGEVVCYLVAQVLWQRTGKAVAGHVLDVDPGRGLWRKGCIHA